MLEKGWQKGWQAPPALHNPWHEEKKDHLHLSSMLHTLVVLVHAHCLSYYGACFHAFVISAMQWLSQGGAHASCVLLNAAI